MNRGEMMRRRKTWKPILFWLPSGVGTMIFYLLPLCYCFLFGFSKTSGRFSFTGLDNYISLFASESFWRGFANTFVLLALCVGSVLLLTLGAVYVLDTRKTNLVWFMIFCLPMLLPPTLIVEFMKAISISPRATLLVIYLWKYTGFHLLLLKIVEAGMDRSCLEAAMLDRANKREVFTRIILPYFIPFMRYLIVFDVICFFRLFRESYLLYGKYPPNEVYTVTNFFFNNFQNLNYQRLCAGAIAMLIPVLILNAIVLKVGEQYEMV